jgi:predicted nucleic acid-binding protein
VSFDTNILVYGFDVDAGAKHTAAIALTARAASSDSVLALQSLAEFYHVTTRKRILEPAAAAAAVDRLQATFPICAADRQALVTAIAAARRHRLPFWDAMLWATVQQAGCRMLLSEDFQDGRRLGSVLIVDPFAPANAALLDEALPPP